MARPRRPRIPGYVYLGIVCVCIILYRLASHEGPQKKAKLEDRQEPSPARQPEVGLNQSNVALPKQTISPKAPTPAPRQVEPESFPRLPASGELPGLEAAAKRSKNNTIMIIPINSAWVEMGLNAWCTLKKNTDRTEVIFLGLDSNVTRVLLSRGLPAYRDPEIPEQAAGHSTWAGKDFNKLVCSKLSAILHLIQRGLKAVLLDADIAVMADVFKQFPDEYDMVWSWGGHLDPSKPHSGRAPPKCGVTATPGRCYVNTGYYIAQPRPQIVSFFKRAEALCIIQGRTRMGDKDDQTYVNELLQDELDDPNSSQYRTDYTTACFDPCRWTNGNTFFAHHTPQNMGIQAYTVHANFLKGPQKIPKLKGAGLWESSCIREILNRKEV